MLVVLGADHAGFRLKEEIARYLVSKNIAWIDLGAHELDQKDDYPDFARNVAEFVAKKPALGILACWTGIGTCITANKVKGIRAANVSSADAAILARKHNDANILCLGSRYIKPLLAKKIVEAFLKQKFEAGRHLRRIRKISKLEK